MEYEKRDRRGEIGSVAFGSFLGTLAASAIVYLMFSPDKDGVSRFDKVFRKGYWERYSRDGKKDI